MGEIDEILRLTGDVGGIKASVAHLSSGQSEIKTDLGNKHRENRESIHELRNQMQTFVDDIGKRISKIEMKVAVGAAIGGMLYSIGSHFVDKLFK